jgi:hypothetical protein
VTDTQKEPTDAELLREVAATLADRLDPPAKDDTDDPADDYSPTNEKEG